jgi:hypothetical protein
MLTPKGVAQGIRRRRGVVALITVAALATWTAEARAECGPEDQSAACQYVEDIPQSGGSQASGGSGSGSSSGPGQSSLSPAVTAEIESKGGPDAGRLKAIATSPAYGAPAHAGDPTGSGQLPTAHTELLDSGSALSAATSAVGSGEAPLLGLLAGLVAVSFAALAFAVRRGGRRAS